MSEFAWDPGTFLAMMLVEIPGYEAGNSGARWTRIDASAAMLERVRERLPEADLRLQRLDDPLPEGPFDLVVSVLAIHHLDGPKTRDLFRRVAEVGDFFVLGDLVGRAGARRSPAGAGSRCRGNLRFV